MMYQVTLDSLVAKDNFYRRLNSELNLSFLYKETARYYGSEGQDSIDPVVFFKICLVGYLNNITSDRKLIETCANRLDIRLYIKYDIDETLPWHSTISRTRQLYGEEVFLSLFRKVLSMCVQKGMVRGKRQAVDSVFVKANASMDSLVERQINEDVAVYAEELDKGSEYKLTVRKEDDKPEGDIKDVNANNKTHYSPTDPDAKISKKGGRPCQLNYYGQIVVDDANHVITAAAADFADRKDSQCVENIVGQTIENFKLNDLSLDQLLADTNYSSGEALRYLEAYGIDGYIPSHALYKPSKEGFIYNDILDRYECTKGNMAVLPYKETIPSSNGLSKKTYRSSTECTTCPLKQTCLGKTRYKQLTHTTDKPYYDRMHKKMQTPYGRKTARLRGSTVEPVLGTLVNFLGMKKVNSKGIKQANKHVLLASVCYNLKKYLKFTTKRMKSMVMAMTGSTEANWSTQLAYMSY